MISRRVFAKVTGLAGAELALCRAAAAIERKEKSVKPNILFIMTDQQHARMMSGAGNRWLSTPAMDSLAREGIRFEKAYCSNPVCSPSRTSMATGVMSCRLDADDNAMGMKVKALPPEVDRNSMGKIMKQAGYDTFYGGKVHMCGPLAPRNAGYDEFFQDQRERLPGACLEFIKRKRSKPFFAVASFINPHDICFAHRALNGINTQGVLELRKEALSLPEDKLPPLPANYAITRHEPAAVAAELSPRAVTPAITMRKLYDDREWRINRWIYHRLTEKVDREIGRILDGLKAAGLEKDTLVVFTSDHGNMDASHHLASKSLFYEESVGVPLIMKLPGRIPAGQSDGDHLVSTGLDLLPTLCDYAGVAKPAHLLGLSLRPVAEGETVGQWRPYVASENEWFRMIRGPRYKYCAFRRQDSGEFLVDLVADPGELSNLAGDPAHRDVLDEQRRLLADWCRASDDQDAAAYLREG